MAALNGKVAWITGAGTGIGKAAALALAAEGAHVVLSGRRRAPLTELAAKLKTQGATVLIKTGDVTRSKTAQNTVDAIVARYGRLDILVNNAGLNIPKRNWRDLQPDGADEPVGCILLRTGSVAGDASAA